MQEYSRQYVVDKLNYLGFRDLAAEAAMDLPNPVDINRLEEWCTEHDLPLDDVISRMGGSA